jgi:arginine exporter protein ArgO
MRSYFWDMVCVTLPCLGIAVVSEALGWHAVTQISTAVGFGALGWFTAQAVRKALRRGSGSPVNDDLPAPPEDGSGGS